MTAPSGPPPPPLTAADRAAAAARGVYARQVRAGVRVGLSQGSLGVAEVLRDGHVDDERGRILARMKAVDLLSSFRGIGPARAADMMRDIGIDPAAEPGKEMHRRQLEVQGKWTRLEQDQERLRKQIAASQENLRREVLRRWPQAANPYTLGFRRFLAEDLDAAQAFIEAHPEYAELRRRQEFFLKQDDQALRLRRERSRLYRIAHLLRIGWLKAALEREGPADQLERYRRLWECESAPF